MGRREEAQEPCKFKIPISVIFKIINFKIITRVIENGISTKVTRLTREAYINSERWRAVPETDE
jgi:hypothetical protein